MPQITEKVLFYNLDGGIFFLVAIKDQQACRTCSGAIDPKVSVGDLALTSSNSPVRTEAPSLSRVPAGACYLCEAF